MSQYGAYGYALHGADYRFILAHYYQGTNLSTTNPQQTVRVLLGTGRSASLRGGVSAAGTGGAPVQLTPSSTYRVTRRAGGLQIQTAAGHSVATLTGPVTVSGPAPLQVLGHGTYRGSLQLSPTSGGVQIVNAVGLDDYVRGVVASEMPSGWAPAALEAQAVAARTYAITTGVGGSGYDLYDDTRSQMYGGVGAETPATDAAVAATQGQVVTYGGRPAVTYFFASSGGYTESIQNVWTGATPEPWLQAVPDPYDSAGGQDPYHLWSTRMSLAAAGAKLRGLVRGTLRRIVVTQRGVSGRVISAQLVGTRGTSAVTGSQLAGALGLATTLVSFSDVSAAAAGRALHRAQSTAPAGTGATGSPGAPGAPVTPGTPGTLSPGAAGIS
jgi:stage II sporulation protein D